MHGFEVKPELARTRELFAQSKCAADTGFLYISKECMENFLEGLNLNENAIRLGEKEKHNLAMGYKIYN